jgi:hypothetical protein
MHKLLITLTVLACGALSGCSPSRAEGVCHTPTELIEQTSTRFPGAVVERIKGDSAKVFVEELNKIPPVTALVADEVYISDVVPSAPFVFAFLFNDGCGVASGKLLRTNLKEIMNIVSRENP